MSEHVIIIIVIAIIVIAVSYFAYTKIQANGGLGSTVTTAPAPPALNAPSHPNNQPTPNQAGALVITSAKYGVSASQMTGPTEAIGAIGAQLEAVGVAVRTVSANPTTATIAYPDISIDVTGALNSYVSNNALSIPALSSSTVIEDYFGVPNPCPGLSGVLAVKYTVGGGPVKFVQFTQYQPITINC